MNAICDRMRSDLLRLGVRPGGALLVHSSLRSLRVVGGGAETVIAALLLALGSKGTLLMPALTYEQVTPSRPVFHVLETPGNVGRIPEVFRYLPGTLRSLHPTHSICAAGVRAEEFVRDHILDSTPCGPHSPLSLLPKVGGQVLMLGCGLEPNTSMHAIEELVEPEYLFDPPLAYRLVLADGRFVEKTYRPHAFHGWSQRYDRLADVMSGGLRAGTVLQASSYLIEADEMWRSVEKQIRVDPLYFVQKAS